MKDLYQVWLNHENLDPDLREELKHMDDLAIEEAFYKPISFGTGGMRGIMGAGINRMNVYTLRKAAYGFARYLLAQQDSNPQEKGVVIAYDNRRKSDVFAKVCVGVLGSLGIKSYLFEHIRPTPLLSFAVRALKASGGIIITASHNPPQYNGFKIYDEDGCQLVPDLVDKVIAEVEKVDDLFTIDQMDFDDAKKQGLVTMLGREMDNEYLKRIFTIQLKPEQKKIIKVVFTPLHGTSREVGLRSLVECGYTVIPVEEQMVADSAFSTVKSPNPEDPKAFDLAIKYGKEHQAELLIATDPDGDRLGLAVLHKGNYVFLNGNQTGAIFLDYILRTKHAQDDMPDHAMVYNTIVTSDFGAKIARTYNAEVHSTLTGFKFIGEQMKQIENSNQTFLMGYEESYGYVIKDFVRDKDSIQAMVLASEIANDLAIQKKTMIDYLHELYTRYGTYREDLVNITLEGKNGEAQIAKIMAYFRAYMPASFEGRKVLAKEDYLKRVRFESGRLIVLETPVSDVLKFILEDEAWFVLRPSGTEPKLKIYIALKAASIDVADAQIETIKKNLLAIIEQIQEPSTEEVNT